MLLLVLHIYKALCVCVNYLFIQQLISYNNIIIIILNYTKFTSYVIRRSNEFSRVRK